MAEVWPWVKAHWQVSMISGGILLGLLSLALVWWRVTPTPPTPGSAPIALSTHVASKATSRAETSSASQQIHGPVYVDVKGAVQRPGVYRATADMRVADVLQLANGLAPQADQRQVNLAAKVTDQQVIYVPVRGEHLPAIATNGSASQPSTGSHGQSGSANKQPLNLNTADVAALQKLTGVGQKKAEKIVAYRQQHGPFKSVNDLAHVNGFGAKTVAKFRDQLTI